MIARNAGTRENRPWQGQVTARSPQLPPPVAA